MHAKKLLAGIGLALSLCVPHPAGAVDVSGWVYPSTSCPVAQVLNPGLGGTFVLNELGQLCTNASGGGGGGGAVTLGAGSVVSGAYLAGALAAGSIVDLGTGATPAANTTNAYLLGLFNSINTAIPAGTNPIGNLVADTHAQCSALCANLVVKASPGTLKTFEVSADSTLAGAIWYVILYDATTAPADGAVTPAKCYQQPSGTTQMSNTLSTGGAAFTSGITIGVSTAGCFSKTASTHAFIAADFQ